MEVEPWEALDLDDSDIPSLLRPCKRSRSTFPTTAVASTAAPNPLSQSSSSQPSEESHPEQLNKQPPPSNSRRLSIPGPAGAVQSAMLRKDLDRDNRNSSNYSEQNGGDFDSNHHTDGVISTQDYIRRAVEDTAEFDDDFTRDPWLSAVQFLGAEDGEVQSTPISSIKKCLNGGKLVQVVAVIKSCTPNGLGGLMVLLKDPTGTVGASIHHKVLSETELGKNITVGAVLILREVAIFAPVKSANYINITLRNLVKVFCQNSGSASKLNNLPYTIQYADPGIENLGKAKTTSKMSTMQNETRGGREKRRCTEKIENLQNSSASQRQNLYTGSAQSNYRGGINASTVDRGHITVSQDVCNEIPGDVIRTRSTGDNQEFVKDSEKAANGSNLEGCLNDMTNTGEDIRGSDQVQVQKQPISKGALPQWTDEQLNELFAGDEDDGSFF